MKTQTGEGEAKVVDYRRKIDGNANPNFGKEVIVPYSFSHKIFETVDERNKEWSDADLTDLANQREKATANSAARQKAVAEYAMTGDDLAREEFIKAYLKMNKKLVKELGEDGARKQAEVFADSALATV